MSQPNLRTIIKTVYDRVSNAVIDSSLIFDMIDVEDTWSELRYTYKIPNGKELSAKEARDYLGRDPTEESNESS